MAIPAKQPAARRYKSVSFDVTLAEFQSLQRYAARCGLSKAAVLREWCQPSLDRIVADVESATGDDAARM